MFYVYLWLRDNGTPYYVGKGHGKRAIRKGSPDPAFIIIQEFESETDAFSAEIFLISYHGRKDLGTGILRNRTDGGEGTSNPSEATRKAISDSRMGKATWVKGTRFSNEHRQRIKEARARQVITELTRLKISASQKGIPKPHSYEHGRAISKAKVGKTHKGHAHSDATRQKMRDAAFLREARMEVLCTMDRRLL